MDGRSLLSVFAGKRITIIGLAREGVALARFLVEAGAQVTVSDLKGRDQLQESIAKLEGLPLRYVLGGHPLELLETDLLFLSPGVPLDAPLVQAAQQCRVPISTETRLFLELCPAPVIGITGSSGKTTTVTLVGEMCRAEGRPTFVGGNIGQPLIGRLGEIRPDDRVVMELSSFQLDHFAPWQPGTKGADLFPFLCRGKSPHIAAILNITPNHLDRHATMEEYIAAKKQIMLHQGAQDYVILGQDDPMASSLRPYAVGKLLTFSLRKPVSQGTFLAKGMVTVRLDGLEMPICSTQEIRLRGRHNVANILAACAITAAAGVPVTSMVSVATRFSGVEHRLEYVRELRGARYYNDSIATSPERAIAALQAFDDPIVLLAGGRDKHLPWDRWAELVARKARHVILFGEAASLIERAIRQGWTEAGASYPQVDRCETMEEAVHKAAALAQPGDVVLLSPGGTSFDAFRDYAERGARFKELVKALV